MRIIPAIDIIAGKCVRLSKGEYSSMKIYSENPLETAKIFEDNGIEFLHLVDLDGAKSKRIVNYKILESIASKTNLKIDFGGGLKTNNDLRIAFESGASQISGGSIAVNNPNLFLNWMEKYGNEKIILGADFQNRKIATNAWQKTSQIDVLDFILDFEQKGIKYAICTDIEKDGMLSSPSNEMYAEIIANSEIKLIASGGVSSLDDLLLLQKIGCEGVIIGKAIYEGRIKLNEIRKLC
jgi:phosphoribosylformimino-5-aminoimidazole carboxamide ribotide isomerase